MWYRFLLFLLIPIHLHAAAPYSEFGGGILKQNGFSGGFGKLAFLLPLLGGSEGIFLHAGADVRGFQTTYLGNSTTFASLYPSARLEWWRLALVGGYTPYVWKNSPSDSLSRWTGTRATLLEIQFLLPITPEIDFGLSAGRQQYQQQFSTTEFGAFFRIYFDYEESDASARRKFRGWRYPFGIPRN